jgi:hypothetical protein
MGVRAPVEGLKTEMMIEQHAGWNLSMTHQACMQVGDTIRDHELVLRAELDNVTPRTDTPDSKGDVGAFWTIPPDSPGSDMLFQAAAAYAAGALALRAGGGSEDLASRAATKAASLFQQAEANPGLYSDAIPANKTTYKSDNWQQYGFLAGAWIFRLTKDASYKTVCVPCLS